MNRAKKLTESIKRILENAEPMYSNYKDDMQFLKDLWNYYNDKIFEGKLHEPVFRWLKLRKGANIRQFGNYVHVHYPDKNKTMTMLRLLLEADENEFKKTLIHEMCHQAVAELDGDTSEMHGELWKKWSKKAGIGTAARSNITQELYDKLIELNKSDKPKTKKQLSIFGF